MIHVLSVLEDSLSSKNIKLESLVKIVIMCLTSVSTAHYRNQALQKHDYHAVKP